MGRKQRKAKKLAKAEAKATKKADSTGKIAWKMLDKAATSAAAAAAPRVSQTAYRALSGKTPPKSANSPEINGREALTWALIGGGLAEATKVAIRRGAADYWVKSTGEMPPAKTKKKKKTKK